MPKPPKKNDEAAELFSMTGPRDPNLPATQLLNVPDEGEAPEFEDRTEPNAVSEDGNTLDESLQRKLEELEKEDEELASQWDDEESTVVDDPTKKPLS